MLNFEGKSNSEVGFERTSESGLGFYKENRKIRVETRAFEGKLGSLVFKERKFRSKPKSSKKNSSLKLKIFKGKLEGSSRGSKENLKVQILKERKLEFKTQIFKGRLEKVGARIQRET